MNKPAALFLAPFLPYLTGHGGGLRLHNLLVSLSERYDVHVLCLARPWERPFETRVKPMCRALDVIPVEDLPIPVPSGAAKLLHLFSPILPDGNLAVDRTPLPGKLSKILSGQKFDLALVAYFSMAHFASILRPAVKTLVVDSVHMPLTDNRLAARHAVSIRSKIYYLSQAWKCRRQLRDMDGKFDAALAVAAGEHRLMESLMPRTPIFNIPIGMPLKDTVFRPISDRARNTVVYVGYYAMDQNVEAAKELCGEIMPRVWETRPDARLELIGPHPERVEFLEVPGKVSVRGLIPAPFAEGWLLAAPIHLGSGFKTKIAEAMAAGLPVVTTSEGNESIRGRHGEELIVAEGKQSFVEEVLRVLNDDSLADRLSRQGRAFTEREFDWAKNIQPLWDFLETK